MDSIIVRTTPDNRPAVFMLESLNTQKGEIRMWTANGEEPRTVGLDVYRTTKPVGEVLEAEVVEKYRQKFNPAGGVLVRARLYKVSPERGGAHVVPKEQDTKNNVLESPENKAAQKREASPQPVQQAQHSPLGDIEKVLLVERITHAFATSFAKSMGEALKEALK